MPGFAFGARALVTVEGRDVVVRAPDGDYAEAWRHTCGASVVAVALAGEAVFALDAAAEIAAVDLASGQVLRSMDAGSGALLLAAAEGGAFTAAGPQGVLLGRGEDTVQMDLRGATALALGGDLLGIGGRDGTVRVVDARASRALGACRVGGAVRGLGRAPGGAWIASTDRAIVRVEREAGEAFEIVGTKELDLGPLACDASGAFVAVSIGAHKVALFDLLEGKLRGTARYEAAVAGVAFSGARLGVGLEGGAFDVIDLETAEGRAGVAAEVRFKRDDSVALLARGRAGEAPSAELRRRPAEVTAPRPTRTAILWMVGFTIVIVALLALMRE